MSRTRKSHSYGLTLATRNRTVAGATPKQIIESLTRNGDFAYFPYNQRWSMRRHAYLEGLRIKIKKAGDHGCVERIGSIFNPQAELINPKILNPAVIERNKEFQMLHRKIDCWERLCMKFVDLVQDCLPHVNSGDIVANVDMAFRDLQQAVWREGLMYLSDENTSECQHQNYVDAPLEQA